MKVVRIILLSLAVLFGLLFVIGFFLPSSYHVERSTRIKAPPEKIYALISDPRQWTKWTVWNERDPAMKITYSGPPSGQGAKWAWESKSEGEGSMEFTRAEPNKAIGYTLEFHEFGMKSSGALELAPAGGATRVTWTNRGDVGGNPLKHYFAAMMDRMVGPDFEKGLSNLKALAEK